MNKLTARYRYTDKLGNTYEVIVRSDNTVVARNQHNYVVSLSSLAFMMTGGHSQRAAAMKDAACLGLAELRRVTKLPFHQVA